MIQLRWDFTLIAWVLGFALGMASLLNFFKFEHTVRGLQYNRIQIVAKEVDEAIQSNLAYSASFDESSSLSQLISQSLQADPIILSADIFGQDGNILFSSDEGRTSLSLPKLWQVAAEQSRRSDWQVQDGEAFVAGRTVTNSFGVKVATVAVRYQRDDYDKVTSRVLIGMTQFAFMILVSCFLVAGAVLLMLMKLPRKVKT